MNKKIVSILLIILLVITMIVPNISKATTSGVQYTRTITGNDGSITINLTGLTLDETKAYSYALTTKGGTPETWHTVTEYTATTATVELSSGTADIANVLKVTDTAALYVKENASGNYAVNALNINVKLPYLQAINYQKESKKYNLSCYLLYDSIGNKYTNMDSDHTYSQWQKVTDKEFISKYVDVKNNKKSITTLESSLPVAPTTGYSNVRNPSFENCNDGLYILWVKLTGDDCKSVYGAIIHDGLENATTVQQYLAGSDIDGPTVSSIAVFSPAGGTYQVGQTVKIAVNFSETITGTIVPTLKIKFGDSQERTISEGKIINLTSNSGHYIEYTYNIQEDDDGQLSTISYEGGNIKDSSGNEAKLSCPVITGNVIIASKTETTTTTNNNTSNQNKTTNNTTSNTTTKNNTTTKTNNTSSDTTIATGTLPKTGLQTGIIALLVVTIVGIYGYMRYKNLRDVK
jgi:hypothetical protein